MKYFPAGIAEKHRKDTVTIQFFKFGNRKFIRKKPVSHKTAKFFRMIPVKTAAAEPDDADINSDFFLKKTDLRLLFKKNTVHLKLFD